MDYSPRVTRLRVSKKVQNNTLESLETVSKLRNLMFKMAPGHT